MGELLGNPASFAIISDGFRLQYHSCNQSRDTVCCRCFYGCFRGGLPLKRCRKRVMKCRVYTALVPVSVRKYVRFSRLSMNNSMMNLQFKSSMVDDRVKVMKMSTGFESDDENGLIENEKEEFELDSLCRNLPPWGNLVVDRNSDFATESIDRPSTCSNVKDPVQDAKVHFLEERNEKELSRRILMLSRSNKVRSAMELCKSMEFSGLKPDAHACNSLLSCLLRNGMLDDALRTFEFMKNNEIITGHTYSLMLKAIADSQGCDATLDMFAELEGDSKKGKSFDVIVYNTALSICGKSNNWVEAERLWRRIQENCYIGTQVTYSLLVSIFVRCNQCELALDAYSEMIRNGVESRDDTMHAVINACAKEGKWDLALSIFRKMLNDGWKPNAVACNALINSLGKAGEIKLAFKIYDIMTFLGHKPDDFTWNSLLGALYRANQHADALHLFERIRQQNSPANLHLYNTALMCCQKLGSWDKALQLLWQLEASGLSVSTTSYNLVIGACETARKPKVALQVYDHMIHQKCVPDTFTHLSLIRSCIWGSLWAEVEEILERVPPDVSLYNAVIHGMCLRGKVEPAKKLYFRMQKCGLKPDGKTRALMLQNLRKDQFKVKKSP
ncbi:Pentatricopeptide repeat-containing protein [Hibiscus syriacus]|uniref:Pentatricopeptide repeat-containing protein n=1 Tax=Hibiscus syriacus TaxID=106335 RepID=A0A6A2WKT4_HIBSY|nr:pentatricopeptide repeat-containing protein At3g29290-like [Hibiscus syriacus]KAE8659491.1 Pentatricopeptide repeat-containing protein [Hibiscus syriacus]